MDAATALAWLERLAIWRGYEPQLISVGLFAIGLTAYMAFSFAFYQNISQRPSLRRGRRRGAFARRVGSSALMASFTAVYVVVLAAVLFFLVKSNTTEKILFTALAVGVAVRVSTIVHELAAVDLAKLAPLALLGVYLVDPGYVEIGVVGARFNEAVRMWPLLWRAFVFLVLLEFALFGLNALRARLLREDAIDAFDRA